LPFQVEKRVAITSTGSNEEKGHYKAWERSNRLSIMFMQMSLANNIKSALPEIENAKEFMKFVEERFQIIDKSIAGTLMSTLTTMKFDVYYAWAHDRDDKHRNKTHIFRNDNGWKFSRAVLSELITVLVWYVSDELQHNERQVKHA